MVSKEKNCVGLLQRGLQYHRSGSLQQAEQVYKQVLGQDPDNVEANHLLGVIACQAEQYEAGIRLIRKALQGKPDHAAAHKNLGKAFMGQGRLDEAAASFQKALACNPDYGEAHNELGIVLYNLGKLDQAAASFKKAIANRPNYAESLYNLGNLYYDQGSYDDAAASFQKALVIDPKYIQAHNNLGNTLRHQGDFDGAAASFLAALAINPQYAEAHNNLGNLLNDQGQLSDAVVHCRRAIVLKPDFGEAHSNLGNALMQQGYMPEAVASFQRALALNQEDALTHNHFSTALLRMGLQTEAAVQSRKALAIQPDFAAAQINLGNALRDQGHLPEAVASYRRVVKPHQVAAHDNLLFTLNYLPEVTQQEIYKESLHWAARLAESFPADTLAYGNTPEKDRRLRIGYVSPDFRAHSVSFFIEPVFEAHNREKVEIFCYAQVKKPDPVTERIKAAADQWLSTVGMDHGALTERIRQDRIDILVDLAGHTGENRLPVFARKPAPVQVTWLGYPNTTGLPTMDYRLTDSIADPAGQADRLHSEQLIRLENGFLCYRPDASAPGVSGPPCLERGHITFGSFNNLTKATPVVIKAWVAILKAIPDSCLLLKTKQMQDGATAERYRQMFGQEGISADRLELHGRMPKQQDHLALYSRVDIGLDPFPYNGTTTTCEALWMGVPVITRRGNRHAARVGASIMHRVGLRELVAESIDGYVQLARTLALDRRRLQDMRGSLREKMRDSNLMDAELFTETLEDAYRQMWIRWCDRQAA